MTSNFLLKYKIIQKIGEGSFSDVVKCQHKKTGCMYAAKRLKKMFRSMGEVMNSAEIKAMLKLSRHPNILYMIEYLYDPIPGRLIFIFELMDMSMFEFMKLKKRANSESRVKNFLYQILRGLEHLHRNGLFHRDIKPENILIKLIGSTQYPNQYPKEIVKLADLGSVRGIYSAQPFTEYISTRWYRSPECLLTNGNYGPKMDIWAAGCVFYEMLTLKPLFPGSDEIDQLAKIHSILGTPSRRTLYKFKSRCRFLSQFPKQIGRGLDSVLSNLSNDGRAILHLMIQYDPDTRSNVRRLIEHRYFNSLRDNDLLLINKNRGDYPLSTLINFITSNGSHTKQPSSSKVSSRKAHKDKYSIAQTTADLSKHSCPSKPKRGCNIHIENNFHDHCGVTKAVIVDHDLTRYLKYETKEVFSQPSGSDLSTESHKQKSNLSGKNMKIGKDTFTETTSKLPCFHQCSGKNNSSDRKFSSRSFVLPRRVSPKESFQTPINNLYLPKLNKQKSMYIYCFSSSV